MNWFRKSKLGYQLRMIKDDEEAAESLGIDARWCKIKAYSIASAFVSVGGGSRPYLTFTSILIRSWT